MKKLVLALALLTSFAAQAQLAVFSGSDTLAGAVTDAINASGMDKQIHYAGGGSGVGEKGLIAGDQGIAPMSREISLDATQKLSAQGVQVKGHVLALDGLSIFVKSNNALAALDIPTIVRIYTCEFTKWEQIPNSGMTGMIKVYRRNDNSGTTDAFKHFTGLKTFGACVQALNETADIADITSKDAMALGYSGLSGKTNDNRFVAIAAKPGATPVLPTTASIRDFSYPMSRKLFVYEVTGVRQASAVEANLLTYLTDRSFMDPIMQQHEFITID